jgi:hypothetical protein
MYKQELNIRINRKPLLSLHTHPSQRLRQAQLCQFRETSLFNKPV